MEQAPHKQIDLDDLQHIYKYMFSLANGNHILRYTEIDYTNYLCEHPKAICYLLILSNISNNWGYEDPRMFENYDEQWLASQIDPSFESLLNFELDDFRYDNLLPYQKAVYDFTEALLDEIDDFSKWLNGGSYLECIYAVFANNMQLNSDNQEIVNKNEAISRGLEMYRLINNNAHTLSRPFENWEQLIY